MLYTVLGEFAKLRKATYVRSVCPSIRVEQASSHWTDFHESLYLSISRKSVEKNPVFM
jgi:hypothetical protein